MRFKVIVCGQHPCAYQFLLQYLHKVKQVLGVAVANVIDLVGRQRQAVFTVLPGGCPVHYALHAFNYVIDISEVTFAVAVVEYLYGFTLDQFVGESEICHVRSAGRAIHREEAQAGAGYVVQFAVAVRQQFIALLGGGVQAYGVIDLVIFTERDFLVAAIHAAGAGINQMLNRPVAAGFKYVVESDEVAFDVGTGIGDAVSDSGLGGKVDHYVKAVLLKKAVYERLVSKVAPDEGVAAFRVPLCALLYLLQAVLLDAYVIVVVD